MRIIFSVICLKRNTKLFFKTVIISAWCCTVFVGMGYYYLNKSFTQTENKTENIPYSQEVNENVGVLFKIGNQEAFFNLDFFNKRIIVSLTPEKPTDSKIYGYPHDFTVQGESEVLINIIDYLNGLELTTDNEKYRYTGSQVVDLIYTQKLKDYEREIIKAICERISKQGVGTDFFADIINNSVTDLKLPDCYFWADEMSTLANNLHFID